MENLIACRPQSFGRYADRAFEAMQQLGIRNVEIPAPARRETGKAAEDLERYGLKASSVTLVHRCQQPDFFDRVGEAVDAAEVLGASVIFTSQHAGDMEREKVYALLRLAGDLASRKSVTIVLETHPDLCVNAKQALETMEAVDHRSIRINFDPANVYYYNQDVDALTELRQIAAYVRAVHLKDTSGGFRAHHFPAIGEGVVDWKAVFALMNEEGMNGPFTLEMEGIAGEDLSFEETYDRIEKSLNYLRSIGVMA